MTESGLSTVDHQPAIQVSDAENISDHEEIIQSRRIKRKLTPDESRQLMDKLLEIEQIKYEERLVSEQLTQLHIEQQHVQSLLNILYAMDADERMKNSRSRQKRFQKIDAKFRSN